ncbi:hypothetical protein [Lutibacter sp.]|uniref:hypothetical protein n=1 Tax=Lutibacter sp. TaxID=1925666 RepID=UPI001A2B33CF|nr:hypothetical protein [Lutibacter sp.]MBI9040672.1 hypothetical protein [Lutibacter sp.]
MDELDILKRDWKKQEATLPKISYDDIYKMIHKKSSSIVKWILIISILELLFWSGLNLLIPDSYLEIYEKFNLKTFLLVTQIIHYVVVVIFIYFFYNNYKAICVSENTNLLMKRIIKTRKTVNYYVYYNIIVYVLLSIILNVVMFSNPETLIDALNPENLNIDGDKFLNIMLIVQIVTLIIMLGLLCLYYRIIYGILLRRLSKNYKELATMNN